MHFADVCFVFADHHLTTVINYEYALLVHVRSCNLVNLPLNDDKQGVMFWIGTLGGTAPYGNPMICGAVECKNGSKNQYMQGVQHYDIPNPERGMFLHSSQLKDTFLKISLEPCKLMICPSAYSVCASKIKDLLHWNFEGSVDGRRWIVIHAHHNDRSLVSGNVTQHVTCHQFYSHFRLFNTHDVISAYGSIEIKQFELYGKVFRTNETCFLPNVEQMEFCIEQEVKREIFQTVIHKYCMEEDMIQETMTKYQGLFRVTPLKISGIIDKLVEHQVHLFNLH